FYVQCRSEEKTYRIVDSANYFNLHLRDMAPDFGLVHFEQPGQSEGREVWTEYAGRCAEIVEAAMTCLVQQWVREGCGTFKTTAPALAMTNFQHVCPLRRPGSDDL